MKIDTIRTLIQYVPNLTEEQVCRVLEVIKSYPNKPGAPHRGIPGRRGGSLSRLGSMERTLAENEYENDPDSSGNNIGWFESYRVVLKGDGRALAKPVLDDEKMLNLGGTIDTRGALESEVATYELSKELGFDGLVPPTIERDNMSMQHWVEGSKTLNDISRIDIADNKKMRTQLGNIMLLDAIIANPDRHDKNMVVDKKGNVYAVDNGLGFNFIERVGSGGWMRSDKVTDYATITRSTHDKAMNIFWDTDGYGTKLAQKYRLDYTELQYRMQVFLRFEKTRYTI